MIPILRGLVLILALLLGVSSSFGQRPDSSFVYGKLVEVTTSSIRYVDFLSSSNDIASTPRTSQTEAFGCSFDDVKPGVNFFMELEASGGSLNAARVYFESCAPFLHFSGNVRERDGNRLVLGNVQGTTGIEEATVVLTEESLLYNCQGQPATADDIRVGDLIAVAVVDNEGTYEVTSLSINERCPTYRSERLVFVELTDDGGRFTQEDGTTIELVFDASRRDPNDPDSLLRGFVYTCTGEFLTWEQIEAGQSLRVTYLDNAEAADVLFEAFLEEGCPQHVGGQITALTSTTIDILEPNGVTETYTIKPETEIWSCRGNVISVDDLRVGTNVKAAFIAEGSQRLLHFVQVIDGCSFAYASAGVITDISDTTVSLITMEEISELYLRIDEASVFVDCLGTIREVTSFLPGDTVVVYYRTEDDGLHLDVMQSIQSCESLRVHGVVTAVGEGRILIDGENGPLTLLVDDKTQIYDCTGATLTVSQDLVGKEFAAHLRGRDSLRTIEYGWVNINCATEVIISGTIVSYQDDVLVVSSQGKQDTVFLSDLTFVVDASGVMSDRSGLVSGRTVCALIHFVPNASPIALHIILDTDCGEQQPGGIRVKGQIVAHHNGSLTLDVDGNEMKVAILGMTNIQHQQYGSVEENAITAGSMAMVTTGRRLSDGTPVAESIVLMDGTTSVDDVTAGSTLVVSPNPVRDRLMLTGMNGTAVRLEIVDMQGRNVLAVSAPGSSVDCSNLSQGAYIVRVTLEDGSVHTTSMLVAR